MIVRDWMMPKMLGRASRLGRGKADRRLAAQQMAYWQESLLNSLQWAEKVGGVYSVSVGKSARLPT